MNTFRENALVQVMYYPSGGSLDGEAFRKIWQLGAYLGLPQATGYLWQDEKLANDRAIDLRFGSLEDLNKAMLASDGPIFGGCAHQSGPTGDLGYMRSTCGMSNTASSVWHGAEAPARSTFEVSSEMLNTYDPRFEHTLAFVKEHVRLADAAGAIYGLVDYSTIADNMLGAVYETVIHRNKPLHRLIEQAKWCQHGWLNSQVRGIYWGNYLGTSICERLAPDFVAQYRELVTGAEEQLQAYIWEFENGLFFSLSLNPLMDRDENRSLSFPVETRVNWLVNEFCKAGLL